MTGLPPKPTHDFFPLRFSPPKVISDAERYGMIEMAAYLRYESRGSLPGHETEDWIAAEADVDLRLQQAKRAG